MIVMMLGAPGRGKNSIFKVIYNKYTENYLDGGAAMPVSETYFYLLFLLVVVSFLTCLTEVASATLLPALQLLVEVKLLLNLIPRSRSSPYEAALRPLQQGLPVRENF
ncbi:unnamed protein product [Amoebophrya sp. A25]|nr:unnamed protein product [Amoebophrya sp. A25]|eukprot:GSA25T00026679001.1